MCVIEHKCVLFNKTDCVLEYYSCFSQTKKIIKQIQTLHNRYQMANISIYIRCLSTQEKQRMVAFYRTALSQAIQYT